MLWVNSKFEPEVTKIDTKLINFNSYKFLSGSKIKLLTKFFHEGKSDILQKFTQYSYDIFCKQVLGTKRAYDQA